MPSEGIHDQQDDADAIEAFRHSGRQVEVEGAHKQSYYPEAVAVAGFLRELAYDLLSKTVEHYNHSQEPSDAVTALTQAGVLVENGTAGRIKIAEGTDFFLNLEKEIRLQVAAHFKNKLLRQYDAETQTQYDDLFDRKKNGPELTEARRKYLTAFIRDAIAIQKLLRSTSMKQPLELSRFFSAVFIRDFISGRSIEHFLVHDHHVEQKSARAFLSKFPEGKRKQILETNNKNPLLGVANVFDNYTKKLTVKALYDRWIHEGKDRDKVLLFLKHFTDAYRMRIAIQNRANAENVIDKVFDNFFSVLTPEMHLLHFPDIDRDAVHAFYDHLLEAYRMNLSVLHPNNPKKLIEVAEKIRLGHKPVIGSIGWYQAETGEFTRKKGKKSSDHSA